MGIGSLSLLLAIFYFFFFAYVGVMMIYLPKVLYNIGYLPFDIGLFFAIVPIVRFLTPFLFAKFELNRKLFLWALSFFILTSFGFIFTIKQFYLFALNLLLMGVCMAIVPAYVETLALEILKKERYGKVRLYGSLGFALVALFLSYFVDEYLYILIFLLSFSLLFGVSAYLISFSKKSQEIELAEPNIKAIFTKERGLWLNILLLQLSFGGFYNFFTIYETEMGFSIETVSYLWIFGVFCEIVMLYFQGKILAKFDLYKIIKFTSFATAMRWFLLFLYADELVMVFITQAFHALSFALYHSAVISYLFNSYEKKRLAQQFYYGIAYGLGMFLGSLFAGAVYGEYLFLASSLIALSAFFALYIKKPQTLTYKSNSHEL